MVFLGGLIFGFFVLVMALAQAAGAYPYMDTFDALHEALVHPSWILVMALLIMFEGLGLHQRIKKNPVYEKGIQLRRMLQRFMYTYALVMFILVFAALVWIHPLFVVPVLVVFKAVLELKVKPD